MFIVCIKEGERYVKIYDLFLFCLIKIIWKGKINEVEKKGKGEWVNRVF